MGVVGEDEGTQEGGEHAWSLGAKDGTRTASSESTAPPEQEQEHAAQCCFYLALAATRSRQGKMLLRDTQLKTEHGGGGARVTWAACGSVALCTCMPNAHGQPRSCLPALWRRVALRIKHQSQTRANADVCCACLRPLFARSCSNGLSWRWMGSWVCHGSVTQVVRGCSVSRNISARAKGVAGCMDERVHRLTTDLDYEARTYS